MCSLPWKRFGKEEQEFTLEIDSLEASQKGQIYLENWPYILYDMQGCRTSISDILTRLSALETELSGVETALAAIVEVTT